MQSQRNILGRMRSHIKKASICLLIAYAWGYTGCQALRPGAVFIQSDGSPFHDEIAAALVKKHVPLTQTNSKEDADYILTGELDAENHIGRGISAFPQASAHAVVVLTSKSGQQLFSCSSTKGRAYNGYRSVAEDCSKRLAKAISGEVR